MSDVVIRADNLGKKYRLGQRQRPTSLREAAAHALTAPWRRLRAAGAGHAGGEVLWALNDVSFEVRRGEVVGLIGRNGAGKSTLLKVLSRVTEPTTGAVEIAGRVGTLLEVGTGFHPELTGRENVYLNGAILGMRKAEIDRKFDEIVAFAEIEKFLDTPVKHYSSGMYVRLGFAVAAHFEPDLLIIDEVLSVGDMAFQQKCFKKVDSCVSEGRTIFLVSHSMASVAQMCTRALLLENGRIKADGSVASVTALYGALPEGSAGERSWDPPDSAPGNDRVRLAAVRLRSGGRVSSTVMIDKDLDIEVDYRVTQDGVEVTPSLHLWDKSSQFIFASASLPSANPAVDEWYGRPRPRGLYRSCCTIPGNFLNNRVYSIDVGLSNPGWRWEAYAAGALTFSVLETGAMTKEFSAEWGGVVRPRLPWRTTVVE